MPPPPTRPFLRRKSTLIVLALVVATLVGGGYCSWRVCWPSHLYFLESALTPEVRECKGYRSPDGASLELILCGVSCEGPGSPDMKTATVVVARKEPSFLSLPILLIGGGKAAYRPTGSTASKAGLRWVQYEQFVSKPER